MNKKDTLVNVVERFSLGIDEISGRHYFSIPVSNRLVDYEEYYEVTEQEYRTLMTDSALATLFAADCSLQIPIQLAGKLWSITQCKILNQFSLSNFLATRQFSGYVLHFSEAPFFL